MESLYIKFNFTYFYYIVFETIRKNIKIHISNAKISIMNKQIVIFLLLSIQFNFVKSQVQGCTDPLASNYNPSATINNGSCLYNNSTISPFKSDTLPASFKETSGLIMWNDKLWTHNDNGDIKIYSFDTNNVNNYQSYPLTNLINNDWEEISQDENYIYIGDFGNNVNGNRTDLKIIRIDKNAILVNNLLIDTISFSYSNQTDFTPTGANNTNFDCESFIVSNDSIFLFTKQWIDSKTSMFSIPKTVGHHIANYRSTLDVQGLITGAVYKENEKLIVLCGYTKFIQPFVYLLYDYDKTDFFNGNKRKINLGINLHQVEAITTKNGLTYYATNEDFTKTQPNIHTPAMLHQFDLSPYLNKYLNKSNTQNNNIIEPFTISPIPTYNILNIKFMNNFIGKRFYIFDTQGKNIYTDLISSETMQVNTNSFPKGVYVIVINENKKKFIKL